MRTNPLLKFSGESSEEQPPHAEEFPLLGLANSLRYWTLCDGQSCVNAISESANVEYSIPRNDVKPLQLYFRRHAAATPFYLPGNWELSEQVRSFPQQSLCMSCCLFGHLASSTSLEFDLFRKEFKQIDQKANRMLIFSTDQTRHPKLNSRLDLSSIRVSGVVLRHKTSKVTVVSTAN